VAEAEPGRGDYGVLPERRLGIVRYSGGIDARSIIRVASALWADPAWRAEFDLLVDLSLARMEVSADERRRMASFFESYPLAS
jgi:hypothetical protein